MSKLVNSLLKTSFALAQTSLESAMNTLKSIEKEDVLKAVNEVRAKMTDGVEMLKTQLHRLTDRYNIEVPFNPETTKINYSIEGNIFKLTKNTQSDTMLSRNEECYTLPDEVNPYEVSQTYDEKRQVLIFSFKYK